jgi:oxygen-independent coproporphyrinogen-3 oxidase
MKFELLEKYDRPVPRYTSYPTAPHFHEGVDGAVYGRWLSELPRETELSLYFHIPFCDTLCWFCGCHTKIVRRYEPIAAYFATLLREVELVTERFGRGRPVRHIHFGGGTPTILQPDHIQRIGEAFRGGFTLTADAEIAVEIDPRELPDETIAALAAIGVTRASLGVQDTNPAVQQAVNRIQPMPVTRSAVERLRAQGIAAINIDLMYGLPGQSVAGVERSVADVVGLAPDRIALFGYAHVPGMKRHQRLIPEAELPGARARWDQAEAAAAALGAAGYRRVGLDHYARADDPLFRALEEGELKRNFQGYTDDSAGALIGFGASAIGALPQGYAQNAVPLGRYRQAIEAGELATARGIALSAEDRRRRSLIERLMCDLSVDLKDYTTEGDREPLDLVIDRPALDELSHDGIVDLSEGRVTVTEDGRALVRCVAAVFDSYLARQPGRHSRAV